MRLINSLRVTRVPIDDNVKSLYSKEKGRELSFYLAHHPKPHTLTLETMLYVFNPRSSKVVGMLVLQDKYRQEWTLKDEKEFNNVQQKGIPLSYKLKGIYTLRGIPHVTFTPSKPQIYHTHPTEHRHERSMPSHGESGLMGSHGPTRLEGSIGF